MYYLSLYFSFPYINTVYVSCITVSFMFSVELEELLVRVQVEEPLDHLINSTLLTYKEIVIFSIYFPAILEIGEKELSFCHNL